MQTLTDQVTALDGLVWQPLAMPLVLVLTGILITIRTGFVQVRRFPLAVRRTLGSAVAKPGPGAAEGAITSFQALSTALASTVGNGNIGGCLTALFVGRIWGVERALDELRAEGAWFPVPALWIFLIRWICPLAIALILIATLVL